MRSWILAARDVPLKILKSILLSARPFLQFSTQVHWNTEYVFCLSQLIMDTVFFEAQDIEWLNNSILLPSSGLSKLTQLVFF